MKRTSVVICTGQRSQVLHETILSLFRQTSQPAEILICCSQATDVLHKTTVLPGVRILQHTGGLTNKRNACIEQLSNTNEYVAFLDDDVELMPNFIESAEALFVERSSVVLINSFVAANGANSSPLTREFALASVAAYSPVDKVEPIEIGYGCNLYVRKNVLDSIRFDERLPLYSMMEDHDFSVMCSRQGELVRNYRTCLAHLASSSGRVNSKQIGYSQLANSLHLWRKGTMTFAQCFWGCWSRFLMANCARIVLPSRFTRKQMAARAHGNLLALSDVLWGRCEPERILEL